MKIGLYNTLRVERFTDNGAYLMDEDGAEVLLPKKYLTDEHTQDNKVEVFVYMDSEDRPVATTEKPAATITQFACLKVKDVNTFGAFLDWGLEKDLFVPFNEQEKPMKTGQWHLVYVYQDPLTKRLAASSKIHFYIQKENIELEENQMVEVLIGNTNELGVQVVIENKYQGLIYDNDIFERLLIGTNRTGFVKKIRTDGKIDITLRKTGMDILEDGAQKIIEALTRNNGTLPLHDKSEPEEIQMMLQMSKKNFKRSLGILYKQKLVSLENQCITKI